MSDIDIGNEESSDKEFSDEEFSDEEFLDDVSTSDDDVEEDLNESTLLTTKNEGFNVSSIEVDFVSEGMRGQGAGRYISENTRLKKLAIKGESMEWNRGSGTLEWFSSLCSGLAHNRSIGLLSFEECKLDEKAAVTTIATISPFIELNTNLQRLDIVSCNFGDESTRLLASALSSRENKSSLQRMILDANGIGDESGRELVDVLLNGYGNLVELSLGDNEIGKKACIALSNLLSSQNSKLKALNIENNQIEDNGITVLTNALASNTTLKELNLSFNCNITQAGWQTFFPCLQNPNSSLETLDISSTSIANEGATALGRSLVNNKTLTALNCYDISADGMPLITAYGWRSVFSCLQNKASAIRVVDLRFRSIDKGGLSVLANALAGNSTVNKLDLSYNPQIPATEWQLFFACFEHPNVMLEDVNLCGNNITDKEMAHLAQSLCVNNGRLETLDLGGISSVTNAGWAHFSRVLCDKSSVTTIYSSNHTLRSLGDQDVIPADLNDLLRLNRSGKQNNVSRDKILRYHFQNGKANIQKLAGMKSNVLHHAIAWICRNGTGHMLLYEFLKSIPSLVAPIYVANTSGVKRKRVSHGNYLLF